MWTRVLRPAALVHPGQLAYRIFPRLVPDHPPRGALSLCTAAPPSPSPALEQELFTEDPAFPDLFAPGRPVVLLGIDPDTSGAIAALRWANPGAVAGAPPERLLAAAQATVLDMPTELWKMSTREKRQPSPQAFLDLLRAAAADADADGAALLAAVEFTTPVHISGKYAWYGSGFATGMMTGLFLAQGVPYHRVSVGAWKRGLGLRRAGKAGSLALARRLFPDLADSHLRRKKDHGRAEALLIAAWAAGVRATQYPDPPPEEETDESESGDGSGSSDGDSDPLMILGTEVAVAYGAKIYECNEHFR